MASELAVTISQLPAGGPDLDSEWDRIVAHVERAESDLVVLPELPFYRWLPATDEVDADRWEAAVRAHDDWIERFDELAPATVVSSRPVTRDGTRANEGFVWTAEDGYRPVHQKVHLPDEAHFWEASWYEPGPADFSPVEVGDLSVGVLICTELWAMERVREYGRAGVDVIVTPRATRRATSETWLAAGRTAAVVSGAFSLSANRSGPIGDADVEFGGQSWCFGPDGERLAVTGDDEPILTVTVDSADAERARDSYPRYALE